MKILSVNEAAAQLQMEPRTIRNLCKRELGKQKIGRDWLLTEADLKRLAKFKDRGPGNPTGKRSKARS